MNKELIEVKQLPIIEERLKTISAEAKAKVEAALALECTEKNYKGIKKVRADLNKDYKDLEDRRKAVKKAVMAPYYEFEDKYKQYVSDVYVPAERELKGKIDDVTFKLKDDLYREIKAFFNEYCELKGIDFLDFDQTGISVGLSSNMNKMKEESAQFIDKVEEELALIETQEHKEEVLIEYRECLNVPAAVLEVKRRHEAIEAERKRAEEHRIARSRWKQNIKRRNP